MDVLGLIIQQEIKRRGWEDFDIQDIEIGISEKKPEGEIVSGKDAFSVLYGVYAYGTADAEIVTIDKYTYHSSDMRYIIDTKHFFSDVCRVVRKDVRFNLNAEFRKATIKFLTITKR